jgi:ABC-type sugar transport system substrate-binding protein
MDARQLVDTMKKILLATVAVLAFASPSFAAETGKAAEPAKTVGQAPPSSASSFYLAQDTGTMKCQVVSAQPAAGGSSDTGIGPDSFDGRKDLQVKTCKY